MEIQIHLEKLQVVLIGFLLTHIFSYQPHLFTFRSECGDVSLKNDAEMDSYSSLYADNIGSANPILANTAL